MLFDRNEWMDKLEAELKAAELNPTDLLIIASDPDKDEMLVVSSEDESRTIANLTVALARGIARIEDIHKIPGLVDLTMENVSRLAMRFLLERRMEENPKLAEAVATAKQMLGME